MTHGGFRHLIVLDQDDGTPSRHRPLLDRDIMRRLLGTDARRAGTSDETGRPDDKRSTRQPHRAWTEASRRLPKLDRRKPHRYPITLD